MDIFGPDGGKDILQGKRPVWSILYRARLNPAQRRHPTRLIQINMRLIPDYDFVPSLAMNE